MPIYEYRCEECRHQFDTLQKMSADPLTECPACGKSALKKAITAAAFHLKGGGWYETDFKGKKKDEGKDADSTDAKKDSSDASESSTKTAEKPETKPAEKTVAKPVESKPAPATPSATAD